MTQNVTLYFDSLCPFAWQTSRWIKEVEKVRDIDVEFTPMSLSVLNEHADGLPEDYVQTLTSAWNPARVMAAVKTERPEMIDALYTALGTRIHADGRAETTGPKSLDPLVLEALAEVGLDRRYLDEAHSGAWDERLRAYHRSGIDAVGDDVGTPVVIIDGVGFFGPVLTRVPVGDEAGEIFDAALRLAQFPYFFELKRSRTEMPQVAADA